MAVYTPSLGGLPTAVQMVSQPFQYLLHREWAKFVDVTNDVIGAPDSNYVRCVKFSIVGCHPMA